MKKKGTKFIRYAERTALAALCVLFLLCGLLYAVKRDRSNGRNKVYAAANLTQTTLEAGSTLEQLIVVRHDFNGISLQLDHDRRSSTGSVKVQITRESTGECVLNESVPVWMLDGGEYNYFAAPDVIAVTDAETFRLTLSYQGSKAGVVTVQTGLVSGDDASTYVSDGQDNGEYSVVCGVVTDYHNHARNHIFTGLAVLAIFVCMAYLFHVLLDQTKEQRHNMRNRTFLLLYAGVITAVMLLRLSYGETTVNEYYSLGEDVADQVELLDDKPIDIGFTIPADGVVGIQLSPLDTTDIKVTEQRITMTLSEAGTGRFLQQETWQLKDQPLNGYYLVFDDAYDVGTRLVLHVQSEGLTSAGVSVDVCSNALLENSLYYSGARQDGVVNGNLRRVTYGYSYTGILVKYVSALLLGALLWYLLCKRRMPLFIQREDDTAYWTQGREMLGSRQSKKQLLLGITGILLFCVIAAEYVYSSGIGELPNKVIERVVSYAGEYKEDRLMPDEESAIVQSFTASEDDLSGIGIQLLESGAADERLTDCADLLLHVTLTDEEGNIVSDADSRIRDLQRLEEYIGSEFADTEMLELSTIYVYVPFEQVIEQSEGETYTLHLYISGGDGSEPALLVAADSITGKTDLAVCYRGFRKLPTFYLTIVVIMAAGLCLLFYATRWGKLPEWKIAFFWILLIGGVLTFVIPLYCVPDDLTHYRNIYALSNRLFCIPQGVGADQMLIRTEDYDIIQKLSSIKLGDNIEINKYNSLLKELFGRTSASGEYRVSEIVESVMGNTTVWTYLPSVIGFSAARAAGFNFTTMIMAARWINLLVVSWFVITGIRKCPYGQKALMVVALFPMLLQLIGSCSYDAMILGGAFMVLGYGFYVAEGQDVSVMDLFILILSSVFLLLNKKGVYFPIVLIAFLAPALRATRKRRIAILSGGGLCLAAAVAYAVRMMSTASASSGAELPDGAVYTIGYLAAHPLVSWHIILEVLQSQFYDQYAAALANLLGVLEVHLPDYVWILISVVLLLSLFSNRRKAETIQGKTRAVAATLSAMGIAVIILTFTITMSYVGSYFVQGIQGRYYIPYIALGAVVLSTRKNTPLRKGTNLLLWMGLIHFYVIVWVFKNVFGTVY